MRRNRCGYGWTDLDLVTGLNETYPGEGLGVEEASEQPVLEPVLT